MKQFILAIAAIFFSGFSFAQQKSEAALISRLFLSLQQEDYKAYNKLFPGIDSLASWVLQYADSNSESFSKMAYLQENPYQKLEFDSIINEETRKNFAAFYEKSKMLNVHWGETVFLRFELEKIRRGRGLISEKISPLRFLGYVFFKDMLTQQTFAFTVNELMQVNGLWYGGELTNIFEADTKEKYEEALIAERKKKKMQDAGLADDTKQSHHVTTDEEENDYNKPSALKEVAFRKFYKGKFDDEIPVQLYVRHIKGGCPEGICSWEALFKFGDEDDFIKMAVSRTADGKWHFIEVVGGMDLVLTGDTYTGTYAMDTDKTEYEVRLKETPISPKKVQQLDEMLYRGLHGE